MNNFLKIEENKYYFYKKNFQIISLRSIFKILRRIKTKSISTNYKKGIDILLYIFLIFQVISDMLYIYIHIDIVIDLLLAINVEIREISVHANNCQGTFESKRSHRECMHVQFN